MIPSPPQVDPCLGLGASLMFVVLSALRRDAARRSAQSGLRAEPVPGPSVEAR